MVNLVERAVNQCKCVINIMHPKRERDFCRLCICTTLKALFEKISFPFQTCNIDDTFTWIDTSLQKVDHILQIKNTIDNNILFTYEFENNSILSFLDTLVSSTNKGFYISQSQKLNCYFSSTC